MSKKTRPTIDRRSQRTRALLSEALLNAGMKGEVDALDVGALAEKAGVGRSTFYAHYASKADFIAASFAEMIGRCEAILRGQEPQRSDVLPARLLYPHFGEAREFARSLLTSPDGARVIAAGEAKLRAIADENLTQLKPNWTPAQRQAAGVFVVGGFMGLLRWQVESGQAPKTTYAAYALMAARTLVDD